MRRLFRHLGALALFAAVLGPAPRASAFCRMTTEVGDPTDPVACVTEGIPLAWTRRCIEYAIDMRGTPTLSLDEVESIAAASFTTWSNVLCGSDAIGFEFQEAEGFADCQAAQYNRSGGNVNAIAFVPELDIDDPSVIALTSVWFSTSTGVIFDADIMINEKQGPYEVCPDVGCIGVMRPQDLQNVLTHEIGHFLGLAHSDVTDATMFAQAGAGETKKRTLAPDDVAGICDAYPPGSLPDTCDFTPKGGRDLTCHTGGGGRGCAVTTAPGAPAGTGSAAVPLLGLVALGAAFVRRRVAGR